MKKMKTFKNYDELLNEEARLLAQIEMSKSDIENGVHELLSITHLFAFLKDKIKKKVKKDFKSKVALKDSLINISMDYVYEKLTSLLAEENEDGTTTGLKPTIKVILDAFYIDYKPIAIAYISEFIDENIEKLIKNK